jgi:hypothetical protein
VLRQALSEARVRRAYVLTKVGVFALAAVATVPLAHLFGPRAWGGLAVFGLVLAGITVAVLAAARTPAQPGADPDEAEGDDGDAEPPGTVTLPVEDAIDLHPFAPRDIPAVVASYLETAVVAGFAEVRLIHGRGVGVQRERVRRAVSRHPAVVTFHDAPPERGGWGATVVVLKARPTE